MTFRKSVPGDCDELFAKLREEDAAEVKAMGTSCHEALMDGLNLSEECCTAVDESGEVIAMFGVGSETPGGDSAVVWLLGSRKVDEHKFEYLRFGKRYMATVMKTFRRASNYCLAQSVRSIRFLKLLGFRFIPEKNVCSNGNIWLYFEMEA